MLALRDSDTFETRINAGAVEPATGRYDLNSEGQGLAPPTRRRGLGTENDQG